MYTLEIFFQRLDYLFNFASSCCQQASQPASQSANQTASRQLRTRQLQTWPLLNCFSILTQRRLRSRRRRWRLCRRWRRSKPQDERRDHQRHNFYDCRHKIWSTSIRSKLCITLYNRNNLIDDRPKSCTIIITWEPRSRCYKENFLRKFMLCWLEHSDWFQILAQPIRML